MMFVISLVAPLILSATPAYAAAATETITPTAWQPASGDLLAFAQANTPSPNETNALRAPGTVINPGLDLTPPADVTGSGNELSMITIPSVLTTCSDETPVDISVSNYTRRLTAEDPSPDNDSYTINGALLDLSGPTLAGYSIDDISTVGSFTDSGVQTYSTTAGNLANIYTFVNFEAATAFGGIHYQGTAELGLPTITLTYDNATCPLPPTVASASVARTVVSPDTASGAVVVPGSSYGASDANGDTLTYSITAGNGAGYFAIDSANGNITTTRANLPVGTYTLTVLVDDGNGGTTTATVTINVTDSLASTGQNTFLFTGLAMLIIICSGLYIRRFIKI
jgi:hypothetical protein